MRSADGESRQQEGIEMMLNGSQSWRYVVDFFDTGRAGAEPRDSMRLRAENEPDALAQADWLARHTYCHHFQVRAVEKGVHSVIYRSPALARAA